VRTLPNIKATPEQLPFISDNSPGVMVVRGAAGSGKTTTAILRLRALLRSFENRRNRFEETDPVRALVLTYNRTLRGYIVDLVEQQRTGAEDPDAVDLDVSTFGKWSRDRLGKPTIVDQGERARIIKGLGKQIALPGDFLVEEVDYALGRFLPDDLSNYLTARRVGRGDTPRVEQSVRQAILNDVILNYNGWKEAQGVVDFNDLAVQLALEQVDPLYDIIIADECQDFSGNQLRAIYNHLAEDHSLTLIIDSVQRIYVRGFTWKDLGIPVRADNTKSLKWNYRNTKEIAALAIPLVAGLTHDEDATLPDFTKTKRNGRRPVVLSGRFSQQTAWVIDYIQENVNLDEESVAFLHPRGGNWFRYIREALDAANLPYVELTREEEWPTGDENIGLVTCHSAKGLEFDHVVMLGLNEECLSVLEGDADREETLRRLIAMSIGRARNFVCLGYKPEDKAGVLDDLDEDTYDLVEV
jgi:superfamily I DNA/RNA helicase